MNFNDIRSDDPGYPGDTVSVAAARTALAALTVTQPRTLFRINARDIYTALGSVNGETVLAAIESTAAINPIFARILDWIQPGTDKGIDICDPEVQGALNSIVGGSVTQAMIDDIIALQNETVPKYAGITEAHIIDARRGKGL